MGVIDERWDIIRHRYAELVEKGLGGKGAYHTTNPQKEFMAAFFRHCYHKCGMRCDKYGPSKPSDYYVNKLYKMLQ